MSFGGLLAGAATGFLTGGPIGAAVGGLSGAIGAPSGSGNVLSGAGNSILQTGENAYLAANEQLQLQQLGFQYAEQQQADSFDNVTSEKSEIMRESNELRNVAMEQRKADNEITKEFIKSIA
jgi:gas vesicle protein